MREAKEVLSLQMSGDQDREMFFWEFLIVYLLFIIFLK